MQRVLSALARLAMALWTGAVAAVGPLVAPRVFGFLDDSQRAGDLMIPLFRTVDAFGIGAGVLFAVAARASKWRAVVAALMGACAAVNLFALSPRIAVRAENWEFYHRLSTGVWTGLLAAGVILVLAGVERRPDA